MLHCYVCTCGKYLLARNPPSPNLDTDNDTSKAALLQRSSAMHFIVHQETSNGRLALIGFFVFNTNLTFLYKSDIEGFEKFPQKYSWPQWDLNSQQQPSLD